MTREEEIIERVNQLSFSYHKGPLSIEDVLKLMADWCDEHPKYNQEQLMQEVNDLQFAYDGKCAEVEQLKNPWRDAKKKLPKKARELYSLHSDELDKIVIVAKANGIRYTAYLDAEEIWRLYPTGRPFYCEITHWMPIPELPKGGEE